MAGLEIYKLLMEQSALSSEQRQISDLAINISLGCKAFEITAVLPQVWEFPRLLKGKTIPDKSVQPPFRKVWLEWDSSEFGFLHNKPEFQGSKNALSVHKLSDYSFRCWLVTRSYSNRLVVFDPVDISPGGDILYKERSFIVCALYVINSSHVETFGKRVSPTLERKIKRSGNYWPSLTWSEVRLRSGETISVPSGATAEGGWKMPWHEVRGHWHWYRTKHGVQRGWADSTGRWYDKPGFWVHNWLKDYERGDQDVGIKRTRYRMVT